MKAYLCNGKESNGEDNGSQMARDGKIALQKVAEAFMMVLWKRAQSLFCVLLIGFLQRPTSAMAKSDDMAKILQQCFMLPVF